MANTKDKKARCWLTVVYPESAPVDWIGHLSEMGMMALISPLHQYDTNADGECKKAHHHVILMWEGPTTYSNALNYVNEIGGVGCLPCATLRGAARYLIHLDNPEKFQYPEDEVRAIGGIDYHEIINSVSDELLGLQEIFDYIEDTKTTSYRVLLRYCRYNREDWFRLIVTTQRENVWRYLRSMEYDLKAEAEAEEMKLRPSISPETLNKLQDQ